MAIETTPLGSFGLRVERLNLWHQLDPQTAQELELAWADQGILVFRRQALSEDELVDFSDHFGDPDVIVREDWQSGNRPEVIQISNMKDYHGHAIGGLGAGELDWHTDQSYVVAPATGSILYMVEMPKIPPTTYWANLLLAYDALDERRKIEIESLQVVYDYLMRQRTYDDEPVMSEELRRKTPLVTHPLVNVHPVNGRKSLYLDPTTASGIEGWPAEKGMNLINELAEHATQSEFVYAHQWQIGDVVMWDNGFLMHRRDAFDASHNRLLKRTTLRLPADRHIVPSGVVVAG